jgi:hypothetical protein
MLFTANQLTVTTTNPVAETANRGTVNAKFNYRWALYRHILAI